MQENSLKRAILFAGDLLVFSTSLFLTLIISYGWGSELSAAWDIHAVPFFWIYAIWALVFYSAGLYDWEQFTPNRKYYTGRLVLNAMLINFAVAIGLFYTVSAFAITPKTNLIIDSALVLVLTWLWRTMFIRSLIRGEKIKIIFLGSNRETNQFAEYITRAPSLGYKIEKVESLDDISRGRRVDLIVVEPKALQNEELVKNLYGILPLGISIINFADFYEHITGKVPTSVITENWFLENLMEPAKRPLETGKRVADIAVGLLLAMVFLSILPIVAFLIKIDSNGRIFFKQDRVGKNGKVFSLIKFRTMFEGAEKIIGLKEHQPGTKDSRKTRVGSILRRTYIDELPQIINILKGEMSFVGPRPERPEYVSVLKRNVPFYETRHLVKPGISGWAQINMKDDASVEDAPEKIQYDLYYIKNRTFFMDLAIMVKTANILLRRGGK
jgi:exopolysaccharide biosynthesis polyprenyl glycosylphosphotransferase